MTDTELLELSAKAVGIELGWVDPVWNDPNAVPYFHLKGGALWNPLTNRSDAFSLMVKLGMDVSVFYDGDKAFASVLCTQSRLGKVLEEGPADQAEALTMRAITRCAAEVGRAMG